MGTGIGTFLKCDNSFQKNKEASIVMEDDSVVQIGASLYGLVNIITKEQYSQFQKVEFPQSSAGGEESILNALND